MKVLVGTIPLSEIEDLIRILNMIESVEIYYE